MAVRRNAADTERASTSRRRQRAALEQREADLVKTMKEPHGRRTLFFIIDQLCNMHGGSYTESPTRTAFNEGKRQVGIELRLLICGASPLDYVHMLSEQLAPERDDSPSQPEAD